MHGGGVTMMKSVGVDKYVVAFIVLMVGLVAYLVSGRQYLSFGVEDDLFRQFIPDAQRFLDGEPLEVPFHPPLYPVLLALGRAVVGDWLTSGLLLSVGSFAISMWLGYWLFREMCGRFAGIGAVAGMAASTTMIAHAGLASSDMLFLACFLGVASVAFQALRTGRASLWFWAGTLVGLAVLTRTNGVSLFAVTLYPLLGPAARARNFGWVLAGVVVPLGVWYVVAVLTGSSVVPEGNHISLAYRYFGEGMLFDDASARLGGDFTSVSDVISRDPGRVASVYARGAYDFARATLSADFLINWPLSLLVVPGLLYLVARSGAAFAAFLVLLVAPQLLLLNLAIVDPRYYLVLVPLFGAAVGATVTVLFSIVGARAAQLGLSALLVLAYVPAFGSTLRGAGRIWSASTSELEQATAALRSQSRAGTLVVARKQHVAYYADRAYRWLPPTLAELQAVLQRAGQDDVLVYIGSEEIKLRPEIEALLRTDTPPIWLAPVARGGGTVPWLLFRFIPPAP
jgi:hypothetical protein